MKRSEQDLAIYQSLAHLTAMYRQHIGKIAESLHVTGAQLHLLISLQPGVSVPMKQLSNHLACDASYITAMIERLVNEKLMTRHEDTADRRVKMVSLTAKGEQVRQLTLSNLPQLLPTAQLTSEEKATFHRLLQKMLQ